MRGSFSKPLLSAAGCEWSKLCEIELLFPTCRCREGTDSGSAQFFIEVGLHTYTHDKAALQARRPGSVLPLFDRVAQSRIVQNL